GRVVAQPLQEGFGELGPGLAVRARLAGAGRQAEGRTQDQHAGHRRDARLLLADDLRQQGPERDRHRIDVPGAEPKPTCSCAARASMRSAVKRSWNGRPGAQAKESRTVWNVAAEPPVG